MKAMAGFFSSFNFTLTPSPGGEDQNLLPLQTKTNSIIPVNYLFLEVHSYYKPHFKALYLLLKSHLPHSSVINPFLGKTFFYNYLHANQIKEQFTSTNI